MALNQQSFLKVKGAIALLAILLLGASKLVQAAEAEGGGLPQFDVSRYPEQIFWFALSFGLLYLLVSKVVMPPISKTLTKRQSLIEGDLAEANQLAEAAKKTRLAYEEGLAKARNDANAMVNEIIVSAAKDAAARQAQQQSELQAKMAAAETGILQARDQALQGVQSAARDLAEQMVQKAAGIRLMITGARQ